MVLKKIFKENIVGFAGMLGLIVWMYWRQKEGEKDFQEFYKETISSVIIDSKTLHGRNVKFTLKDGNSIIVFVSESKKIFIGDSVHKEHNTADYKIYRENMRGEVVLVAESVQGNLIFNE